jgi:hypothetical protein
MRRPNCLLSKDIRFRGVEDEFAVVREEGGQHVDQAAPEAGVADGKENLQTPAEVAAHPDRLFDPYQPRAGRFSQPRFP